MATTNLRKTTTIIGSSLLAIIAALHGSGIKYLSDLMQQSNAEGFLKDIFPVLFAQPSIQLFGLATLGIMTLFMKHEIEKILFFIFALVFINSVLAFYLGANIPGIILLFSSLTFGLGGMMRLKQKRTVD